MKGIELEDKGDNSQIEIINLDINKNYYYVIDSENKVIDCAKIYAFSHESNIYKRISAKINQDLDNKRRTFTSWLIFFSLFKFEVFFQFFRVLILASEVLSPFLSFSHHQAQLFAHWFWRFRNLIVSVVYQLNPLLRKCVEKWILKIFVIWGSNWAPFYLL